MTFAISKAGPAAARTARTTAAVVLATLAACTAGGCRQEEDPTRVAGWSMIDPAQRHAIEVSREPEQMSVQVPRGSRGLSPAQKAQVVEFAARARASDAGNTKMMIAAPAGSANEIESAHAVDQIRHLFSEGGIADSAVGLQAYEASGEKLPAVRIAFFRFVAHAPHCGNWPTNLAREPENIPYPNFGCATQRNFANMVANPADLVEPRTETERSSERRSDQWGKYVKGEHTGAQRSPSQGEKLETIE